MRKKILLTMALAMLLAWPLGSAFAYEAFIGPTGVLQYNQAKSYGGYTLFSMTGAGNTKSYLIDMEGYVVHEWKTDYVIALCDFMLPNGHLMRAQKPWADAAAAAAVVPGKTVKLQQQAYTIGGGHGGLIQDFDWDGNLTWEYEMNTSTMVQHHTFTPHPTNGNVLILGWEYKSYDESVAKGRNPATVDKTRGLWPDFIREVNRAGQTVWEYHVWDNLVQNFDATKPNYGQPKDNPTKFDINWINPGMDTVASATQDWTHWNTANYDIYHYPTKDWIVANSRHFGESYIIDKATKQVIYRVGNPSAYGMGIAPSFQKDGDQLIFGPHHAHIIDPGLPGAGHLLILDNGWNRPAGNRTRTIEIDLSLTTNAPMQTTVFKGPFGGALVWQYFSATPNSLYSASQCSNQRLPNGNTMITSTQSGHVIEVTNGVKNAAGNFVDKEVVWEFISPVMTDSAAQGVFQTDTAGSIHRANRYGVDFAGLAGRDLTRKYHISGQPEFWRMLGPRTLISGSTVVSMPTTWTAGGSNPTVDYSGFGYSHGGSASGGGGGTGGTGGGSGGGGY